MLRYVTLYNDDLIYLSGSHEATLEFRPESRHEEITITFPHADDALARLLRVNQRRTTDVKYCLTCATNPNDPINYSLYQDVFLIGEEIAPNLYGTHNILTIWKYGCVSSVVNGIAQRSIVNGTERTIKRIPESYPFDWSQEGF